jgi:hypothetical protein
MPASWFRSTPGTQWMYQDVTIQKNFYFPAMFQCIVAYIQSCNRCQQIKGKRDTVRTFHERITAKFEPFETIVWILSPCLPLQQGTVI